MTKPLHSVFKFEPQDGTIPTKKEARRLLAMFNKRYPEVKKWDIYIDGQLTKISAALQRVETKQTKRKTKKAR